MRRAPRTAARRLALLAFALALLGVAPDPAAAQAAPAAPVAARDLPRGAVLTAADIEAPSGAGAGVAPGWVTRRVIRAGEALRAPAVAPPERVRAGETVQVVWRGERVRLSLRGTAARSAGEGERVAVRIGTGWRVEGVVTGEGVVQIEPEQEGVR